jgi:hypothetical protein
MVMIRPGIHGQLTEKRSNQAREMALFAGAVCEGAEDEDNSPDRKRTAYANLSETSLRIPLIHENAATSGWSLRESDRDVSSCKEPRNEETGKKDGRTKGSVVVLQQSLNGGNVSQGPVAAIAGATGADADLPAAIFGGLDST